MEKFSKLRAVLLTCTLLDCFFGCPSFVFRDTVSTNDKLLKYNQASMTLALRVLEDLVEPHFGIISELPDAASKNLH